MFAHKRSVFRRFGRARPFYSASEMHFGRRFPMAVAARKKPGPREVELPALPHISEPALFALSQKDPGKALEGVGKYAGTDPSARLRAHGLLSLRRLAQNFEQWFFVSRSLAFADEIGPGTKVKGAAALLFVLAADFRDGFWRLHGPRDPAPKSRVFLDGDLVGFVSDGRVAAEYLRELAGREEYGLRPGGRPIEVAFSSGSGAVHVRTPGWRAKARRNAARPAD
jgi:hypothetical protein